jgi:hypothetical protein
VIETTKLYADGNITVTIDHVRVGSTIVPTRALCSITVVKDSTNAPGQAWRMVLRSFATALLGIGGIVAASPFVLPGHYGGAGIDIAPILGGLLIIALGGLLWLGSRKRIPAHSLVLVTASRERTILTTPNHIQLGKLAAAIEQAIAL